MTALYATGVVLYGTGNELSRVLGWGANYSGEKMRPIIAAVAAGPVSRLDLWRATITPQIQTPSSSALTSPPSSPSSAPSSSHTFCCFFSVVGLCRLNQVDP
jgi:hypothetical protein